VALSTASSALAAVLLLSCATTSVPIPESYVDPSADLRRRAAKDEVELAEGERTTGRILEVLGGVAVVGGTATLVAAETSMDPSDAGKQTAEIAAAGMLVGGAIAIGAGALLELSSSRHGRRATSLALQAERLETRAQHAAFGGCSDSIHQARTAHATALGRCFESCAAWTGSTDCRDDIPCRQSEALAKLIRDSAWCE